MHNRLSSSTKWLTRAKAPEHKRFSAFEQAVIDNFSENIHSHVSRTPLPKLKLMITGDDSGFAVIQDLSGIFELTVATAVGL